MNYHRALDFDPRNEHGDGQYMADERNCPSDDVLADQLVDWFSSNGAPVTSMIALGFDAWTFIAAENPFNGVEISNSLNECIRDYAVDCVDRGDYPEGFRYS